jgi:hypothetical protein
MTNQSIKVHAAGIAEKLTGFFISKWPYPAGAKNSPYFICEI